MNELRSRKQNHGLSLVSSSLSSAGLHLQIILELLFFLLAGSDPGLAGGLLVPLQAQHKLLHLLELRVELRPGEEDEGGGERDQGGDSEENLCVRYINISKSSTRGIGIKCLPLMHPCMEPTLMPLKTNVGKEMTH